MFWSKWNSSQISTSSGSHLVASSSSVVSILCIIIYVTSLVSILWIIIHVTSVVSILWIIIIYITSVVSILWIIIIHITSVVSILWIIIYITWQICWALNTPVLCMFKAGLKCVSFLLVKIIYI